MEIPGKQIALFIESLLKKEIKKIKRPLKLVTILVGESVDQISFVTAKKNLALRLGIKFEFIHIKKIPTFESFINLIKTKNSEKETTALIIQQPLPPQLETESIYDFISLTKEIEGHRKKTTFLPPLGLAVLTILKYVFGYGKINSDLLLNFQKDKTFFKRVLRNTKIVLVGRGAVGGRPIGKTMSEAGINYINIHSETPNPEDYYKEADVIITAVGKKVIRAEMLKTGAILINAGLRRENGKLKGDYDEREIKNIAKFYTPTPGGVGPIDILYLYKNLIDAAKLQKF